MNNPAAKEKLAVPDRVLVDGQGYSVVPHTEDELLRELADIDAQARKQGQALIATIYADRDADDPPLLSIGLGADESVLVYSSGHWNDRLLVGQFQSASLGQKKIKGVSHAIEFFQVHGVGVARSSVEAAGAARLTPLTGRDNEISLLKDRWEQAQEGMGQVVLLVGEAGLGKSRLVYALKEHVQGRISDDTDEDALVIEWRCAPHYQNTGLYPAIDFYERAFGGTDRSRVKDGILESEPRNPAGTGFLGKKTALPIDGVKLPNLEDPKDLISSSRSRPKPMGFGPLAPDWEPRRSFVGTYDEAWQKNRAPYLPNDFNPRFFNAAPADLVAARNA